MTEYHIILRNIVEEKCVVTAAVNVISQGEFVAVLYYRFSSHDGRNVADISPQSVV